MNGGKGKIVKGQVQVFGFILWVIRATGVIEQGSHLLCKKMKSDSGGNVQDKSKWDQTASWFELEIPDKKWRKKT